MHSMLEVLLVRIRIRKRRRKRSKKGILIASQVCK